MKGRCRGGRWRAEKHVPSRAGNSSIHADQERADLGSACPEARKLVKKSRQEIRASTKLAGEVLRAQRNNLQVQAVGCSGRSGP